MLRDRRVGGHRGIGGANMSQFIGSSVSSQEAIVSIGGRYTPNGTIQFLNALFFNHNG